MIRRRRGHGEGLIRQRADGRWEARVDLGWQNGKRVRKSIYAATRTDLQTKLVKALRERDQGILPSKAASPSVGRLLADWLARLKSTVRQRSWERYETVIRLHIEPTLGKVRLEKLSPVHVQRLLDERLAASVAPRSVQQIRGVLQSALKQAEKWGLVARNVASLVNGPTTPHKEMKTLTPAQAGKFLEACRGEKLEGLYWLAITTGMRRGELLALKWSDIDLDAGTLAVQRSLARAKSGIIIQAPKTAKGRRTVQLCAPAVARLREHRVRQNKRRLFEGPDWRDGGYVFSTGIGTTLDPRNLELDFHQMLKKAGLDRIRFHDLRHSAATIALAANVHPKIVSEMLGHSKISLTLDVYSHALPNMQAEAAEKIAATLGGLER